MADIQSRVNQANGRLKAVKTGASIQPRGNRLYLRATLPPKPSLGKTRPFRQEISLGVYANPAGVAHAENEARLIGALLSKQQFSWEPYLRGPQVEAQAISTWVQRFEADYFTRRDRNPKSETTWQKDYHAVLKRLPTEAELRHKDEARYKKS